MGVTTPRVTDRDMLQSESAATQAHERSPLLDRPCGPPPHNRPDRDLNPQKSVTPLPKAKLYTLIALRITEPVAYASIFPYIASEIADMGIAPGDVGFYVGLIEGSFAFCSALTAWGWGLLSNRWGRKPTIMVGMLGTAISITCFGFSSTFLGLIMSRSIGGLMNGNTTVMQTALAEICTKDNQAQAMSLWALGWGSGVIIGPLIGGYLSRPADRWPEVFGSIELFKRYPYCLPALVAALFPLLGVIAAAIFLEETMPSTLPQPSAIRPQSSRQYSSGSSTSTLIDEDGSTVSDNDDATSKKTLLIDAVESTVSGAVGTGPAGAMASLTARPPVKAFRERTILNILVYVLVNYLANGLFAVIPLFAYTPVSLGGLGMNEDQIGSALGSKGFASVSASVFLLPALTRRYKLTTCLTACILVYMIVFACYPFMGPLARTAQGSDEARVGLWILLIGALYIATVADLTFPFCQLLLNLTAPTPQSRASINGISQSANSFIRSIAPPLNTTMFAMSIEHNFLRTRLPFFVLMAVGLGTYALSRRLAEVVRREDEEYGCDDEGDGR